MAATRTSAGPAVATHARRNPNLVRRSPAITINYEYLRHDIRYLAVLAPTMIVLLMLAFVFLH
jgi:hypothetical protein